MNLGHVRKISRGEGNAHLFSTCSPCLDCMVQRALRVVEDAFGEAAAALSISCLKKPGFESFDFPQIRHSKFETEVLFAKKAYGA